MCSNKTIQEESERSGTDLTPQRDYSAQSKSPHDIQKMELRQLDNSANNQKEDKEEQIVEESVTETETQIENDEVQDTNRDQE